MPLSRNNNAARIEKSERLQRLLKYLRAAGFIGATTREIIMGANVVAVNTAVHELRTNGYDVTCKAERANNRTHYRYILNEHAE